MPFMNLPPEIRCEVYREILQYSDGVHVYLDPLHKIRKDVRKDWYAALSRVHHGHCVFFVPLGTLPFVVSMQPPTAAIADHGRPSGYFRHPAILDTSMRIRAEALPLFFLHNVFHIHYALQGDADVPTLRLIFSSTVQRSWPDEEADARLLDWLKRTHVVAAVRHLRLPFPGMETFHDDSYDRKHWLEEASRRRNPSTDHTIATMPHLRFLIHGDVTPLPALRDVCPHLDTLELVVSLQDLHMWDRRRRMLSDQLPSFRALRQRIADVLATFPRLETIRIFLPRLLHDDDDDDNQFARYDPDEIAIALAGQWSVVEMPRWTCLGDTYWFASRELRQRFRDAMNPAHSRPDADRFDPSRPQQQQRQYQHRPRRPRRNQNGFFSPGPPASLFSGIVVSEKMVLDSLGLNQHEYGPVPASATNVVTRARLGDPNWALD